MADKQHAGSAREVLVQALVRALSAVEYDEGFDVPNASKNYKEAVAILEDESLQSLSSEQRAHVGRLLQAYKQRADFLSAQQIQDSQARHTGLEDIGIPVMELLEQAPRNMHEQPFWLMRLLAPTLESGGYIKADVYVPRRVWLQGDGQLGGIKLFCVETVHSYVQRLEHCRIDDQGQWGRLEEDLAEFCFVLDRLQNDLSKKLTYIPATPVDSQRTMVANMQRAAQVLAGSRDRQEQDRSYVDLLPQLFKSAQCFVKWLGHVDGKEVKTNMITASVLLQLRSHIHRVCDFMHSVLLVFIVRDLNTLIDRHLHNSMKAVFMLDDSTMLPVEE